MANRVRHDVGGVRAAPGQGRGDRGMGKETHGFGGEDYSASLTQRTKLNSFLRE